MLVDVFVIQIPKTQGTVILELKPHSGRLTSEISGNPVMYPISVRYGPKTYCCVLIVQIIFLQNNIFICNLLCAFLYPHTRTTHTTKPHTPEPGIPTNIYHIVIIFIVFLWYKTIFSTNPHCVSININNKKQTKNDKGFTF